MLSTRVTTGSTPRRPGGLQRLLRRRPRWPLLRRHQLGRTAQTNFSTGRGVGEQHSVARRGRRVGNDGLFVDCLSIPTQPSLHRLPLLRRHRARPQYSDFGEGDLWTPSGVSSSRSGRPCCCNRTTSPGGRTRSFGSCGGSCSLGPCGCTHDARSQFDSSVIPATQPPRCYRFLIAPPWTVS